MSSRRNRYDSSSDDDDRGYHRSFSHSGGGYDSISHSRSFSIERRNDYGRRSRGDRYEGSFGGGSGRSGRRRSPSPPPQLDPVEGVKLNVDLVPSTTKEEQEKFLKDNNIKLQIGNDIPAPALSFEEMKLPESLMKQIKANGWEKPTPIQAISIPVSLKGRDLIGIAQTGSGKTGSFIIPAIMHIQLQPPMRRGDGPIVLVLSPTRELAQQTSEVAQIFLPSIRCHQCCIFGGAGRGPQLSDLRRSPALVVATPGRLIDFMEQGVIRLDRVNFLILDEADRMLDMGFEPQIRQIIGKIGTDRQTIMFSATWPKEIRKLAEDFLVDPIHMTIGLSGMTINSSITQIVEKVEEYEKLGKALAYLEDKKDKKIIIFTKTKKSADDLADRLSEKGIKSMSFHGDKPQTTREYILKSFKHTKNGVLVATDVAARGLDVTDIDIVMNFDFPGDIDSYIHRIGRTARGSKEGVSISYFTDENKNLSRKLFKVMKTGQQKIPDWLQAMAASTPRGASRQGRGFGRSYGGGYGGGGYRGGRGYDHHEFGGGSRRGGYSSSYGSFGGGSRGGRPSDY